jgi:type IV secretory pathway TraG/TraD family ATPase VirD4
MKKLEILFYTHLMKNLWISIDDLTYLKKLPFLSDILKNLTIYGGAILAGVKSSKELYQIYGYKNGLEILDRFNTKIVFRTVDKGLTNYICNKFSYIISDYTGFNQRKFLVTNDDLLSLKDNEAFIYLPNKICKVVKINISYHYSKKI